MQSFIKNNKIKIRDVNSWENGKIHYWAESHNSQIETLDFALVRTFYWHTRSLIAGGAPRGGGDCRLTLDAIARLVNIPY